MKSSTDLRLDTAFAALAEARAKGEALIAENGRLRMALERIGDPQMWSSRMGELIWRGESADGNLIETEDPREIARAALERK